MTAPSDTETATPHAARDVVRWLTDETRDERFIDNIFAEMCLPSSAGRHSGQAGDDEPSDPPSAMARRPDRLVQRNARGGDHAGRLRCPASAPEYIGSPVHDIHQGATEVRERLERDPSQGRKHALYDEMRAMGPDRLCGLAAAPHARQAACRDLRHRPARRFRRRACGGAVELLLPLLALVSEIRMKNRLARTLLETYVGAHAGELILAGATRRGSGTTVRAAIMICDLRDFTKISDNWPRDDVIDLLNDYFDAMSEPIAAAWRRDPEVHRRRPARDLPAQRPQRPAPNLLRAVSEGTGSDGGAEREEQHDGARADELRHWRPCRRRHVRQYRLAQPARLHRDRSRREHGLAARNPHQAVEAERCCCRARLPISSAASSSSNMSANTPCAASASRSSCSRING